MYVKKCVVGITQPKFLILEMIGEI